MTDAWRSIEPFVRLTPRQCEVVELVSTGLTNRQIASRLCLELRTVDKHMHDAYARAEIDRSQSAARVMLAVLVVEAKTRAAAAAVNGQQGGGEQGA